MLVRGGLFQFTSLRGNSYKRLGNGILILIQLTFTDYVGKGGTLSVYFIKGEQLQKAGKR